MIHLANFRTVNSAPIVTSETSNTAKRGRPVGSKNRAKAVTEAPAKQKGSVYAGSYGRIPGIVSVELLDGVKYRIFASGAIGAVNVRLRLQFANGDSQIMGPASMTFLEDRDDAWRKANNKTNNRSALNVSELDGWGTSEASNWANIIANFGERKIKAGEESPVITLDDDDDDDDDGE